MIETSTKSIDGIEFAVTQFPARRGMQMQARLAKILGPIVGGLAGALEGAEANENIGKALAGLAALNADEFATLALDLLASTRMEGREITSGVFDMEFAGKYDTLYKALAYVVQVNFGSLFKLGDIGSLFAARMTKAASQAAPLKPA